MSIDEKAFVSVFGRFIYRFATESAIRQFVEAYEAAKTPATQQPINKAALDQASAARKQYRSDAPITLYSIEGEDAVFIAAYLEAASAPATGQPEPRRLKDAQVPPHRSSPPQYAL
jgi:hypothetical protein